MNIALLITFGVLSFFGLLGIIVPGLPDTILIFAGALIYTIITHFQEVTFTTIFILAGLTIITNILDWVRTIYGAKKFGATKYGIIGAIVGGIFGFIILSFIGFIIFSIIGTVIVEIYIAKKKYSDALRAGTGILIGVIASSIIKTIIATAMIVLFVKNVL